MSHSLSSLPFCRKTEKARNCHNLLMSSRVRRDMMTDRLDAEWQELRPHVSIESDMAKLSRLTAECGKRNRKAGRPEPAHRPLI